MMIVRTIKLALAMCIAARLLVCAASAEMATIPDAAREIAEETTQIVAVAWREGVTAELTLYEKSAGGEWTRVLETEALVGERGLGKTREGDNMTPEGAFTLSMPFGILEDPGARMEGYVEVAEEHYWSGASGTEDYNRLVDTRVRPDYAPSANDEHLIEYPGYYDYGLFIGYNSEGDAGAGSAIFLHCIGEKPYTSGCVAIEKDLMRELLTTLDDGAMIVIYRLV